MSQWGFDPEAASNQRISETLSSVTFSGMAGAHILVVDDNEMNRDMLKLRLEVRGFRVTTAEGGREALAVLDRKGSAEEFDTVLLDVMMPEISGLDVLREAREHYGIDELPIIMATAKDESGDVVEALSLGANDYVTKPIDFPVLFARLETQLRLKRLAAQKDDFLAIASHDLKNPLSVVRGFAKMLVLLQPEGSPMTGESRELLGRIVNQTMTMERIVNDFLDFQALEDGRIALYRAQVDVRGLAKEVVDQLGVYAKEKKIDLQLAPATEESAEILSSEITRLDAARIRQVVENLVGNALKFSPGGTAVEVRVRASPPPQAGDEGSSGANGILLEVVDAGPGVPAEEAGRLFVKYAKLSNRPTGGEKSSGLGLAISKQLVELHRGLIGARNNEGRGSTFWFWLPRRDKSTDTPQ